MASARLGKILRTLDRIEHCLDLDRDGLGDRLIGAAVEVIARDFDRGVAPDGTPWDELSPAYLAWKQRHAVSTQMGIREGWMADPSNFEGARSVSAAEARWTFGTDELSKQEAEWFIEGDPARNRPPRPFVGLSAAALAKIRSILNARLKKAVQ